VVIFCSFVKVRLLQKLIRIPTKEYLDPYFGRSFITFLLEEGPFGRMMPYDKKQIKTFAVFFGGRWQSHLTSAIIYIRKV